MRETILLVAGAIVAVFLQIVLAPNVSIFDAMPDFVLVYVGVVAMLRQNNSVIVAAFCLGLILDLTGTSSVGIMAALLTLAAFATGRVAERFDTDALGASIMMCAACFLSVELLYACYYAVYAAVPLADALLLRALPCALYDCAVGLIMLPLLSRLFAAAAPSHTVPGSSSVKLR